ncbi:MAG: hypothetical protein ACI4TE_05110 [Alphaproteobacteria bacterium]
MRCLINILCGLIFFKQLRKTVRNKLNFLFFLQKLKKIRKAYPEAVVVVSPKSGGIGELTRTACSIKALKEKYRKNVVVLVDKSTEYQICRLFSGTFVCHYDKNLFLNCAAGRVFLQNEEKQKRFVEEFWETKNIERLKLSEPRSDIPDFSRIVELFKREKTVFIFPYANTYDSEIISRDSWLLVARSLQDNGFFCVFNSHETYEGFLNVFMPIHETLYLASLCRRIIAFRSGMAELISIATEIPMFIIYPNGIDKCVTNMPLPQYRELLKKQEKKGIYDQSLIIRSFKKDSLSQILSRQNAIDFYYNYNDRKMIEKIKSFF